MCTVTNVDFAPCDIKDKGAPLMLWNQLDDR